MKSFIGKNKPSGLGVAVMLVWLLLEGVLLGDDANCPLGQTEQTCPCCSTKFCAAAAGRCQTCDAISISVSGPGSVAVGGSATYTCTGGSDGSYTWSIGDFSGPTSGQSVPLTAPSTASTAVGDKTVSCTFEKGDCTWDASMAVTIAKVTATTVEPAADGTTGCSRTRIGVLEDVVLHGYPEVEGMSWSATKGTLSAGSADFEKMYKAEDAAGNSDVSFQLPGISDKITITFSVVEPAGYANATVLSTMSYPIGTAGAGMQTKTVITPADVSFKDLVIFEEECPASNEEGYFGQPSYPHSWENGALRDITLNYQNASVDNAGGSGFSTPWSSGHMEWNIPVKWVGATGVEENQFTSWVQEFDIDATGTVTVSKFGHSVTRTSNNVYQ